jgi:type IV pilus assembly protein PilX
MASSSLRPSSPAAPLGQHGAALATTLILLVIVTLIALGATRFVAQEEKMAGAILDRAIAFQSAEAGLRRAESLIPQNPPTRAAPPEMSGNCNQTSCTDGLCFPPDPDCPPRWKDPSFTGWHNWLAQTDERLPVEGYIEYLGEFLGWPGCDQEIPLDPNCMSKRYRVVARAQRDGGATVILESVYQRP